MGEHFLFSLLMTLLLLGCFTVISLVMLWAPSTPFPMNKEAGHQASMGQESNNESDEA